LHAGGRYERGQHGGGGFADRDNVEGGKRPQALMQTCPGKRTEHHLTGIGRVNRGVNYCREIASKAGTGLCQ
jgi:hypothetical protein